MGTGTAVLLVGLLAQQLVPPDPAIVSTSVRPDRVRVGGRVVLTVRVDYNGDPPREIQLVHAPQIEVVDIIDRRRAQQWERDFVLMPTGVPPALPASPTLLPGVSGERSSEGGSGMPNGWVVEVEGGGEVLVFDVAPPTVESAGDWQAAAREEDPVRGLQGQDQSAPGGLPITAGVPYANAGPTGAGRSRVWRRPLPGGWAESAHLDPWWPEVVPEFYGYESSTEDASSGMTFEAGVVPRTVYVGQQFSVFSTVSVRPGPTFARPRFTPARPAGFTHVEVGAVSHPSARAGDLEHSLTFQTSYFPSVAGEWAVPTGQVAFGGPQFMTGPPVGVTVLPIPLDGAPSGYNGAVGRFTVQATLEPRVIAWGQQARLRVEVRGAGDVRNLGPPTAPHVIGGVLTPYRDMAWAEVRDGVVGGVRIFEYLLSPAEAGPVELAPIVFTYFDPYVGDFGMAATEELRLDVR